MREENIVTISDYLRGQFPGFTVEDEEVSEDHVFRIVEKEGGGEAHRLQVSENFLDDTPPLEIAEELEKFDVAGFLRRSGIRPAILTAEGAEALEG